MKDRYSITGVSFEDIRVDGTGTSVVSARVQGSASFRNVDARHVGAVGVNNCGSFNFPATGSEHRPAAGRAAAGDRAVVTDSAP